MITLLVTGGAGFIGSNFIHYLLKQSSAVQVVNVDVLTYAGHPENLSEIESESNYHFEKGDVRDAQFVREVFHRHSPEIVVHFAAETHVDRSIENPELFLETNVMGTRVLLDEARRSGVERVIQISTDEVYGPAGPGQFFTEEAQLRPSSPYAASKAAADLLALSYWTTFRVPVVISRCTNNYGPRQFPEKFIPLIIDRCLAGQPVPLYGDGRQERDWLYVEDHCAAVHLLARHGRPGHIYNLAGHHPMDNLSLAKMIIDALKERLDKQDPRCQTLSTALIQHVTDRKGHDRRYALNDCKFRQELGWSADTGLSQGIGQAVDWYLSNPGWWDRVRHGSREVMR